MKRDSFERRCGQRAEAKANENKKPGKRRPNPTIEQMREAAMKAGVGLLFENLDDALTKIYPRFCLKFGVSYQATMPEGAQQKKGIILQLVPSESSSGKGLRYNCYLHRVSALTGKSEERIKEQLPPGEDWSPWLGEQGWAGYIHSNEDVGKVVKALTQEAAVQAL